MNARFLAAMAALALAGVQARAAVRLPALFSDHAVLQAEQAVPVWGWAAPGEKVTVRVAGQTLATQADGAGRWRVQLAPLSAGATPLEMTVAGENTLTVHDILAGDAWLCSGQSNMEMQLRGLHGQVDRADEEIAAANYPQMRMFVHAEGFDIYALPAPGPEPLEDRAGAWVACSPETAAKFSAMAYFVGRELHQRTGRPMGLAVVAVGGTPIEAWTSLAAQQAVPALQPLLADWQKTLGGYDPAAAQAQFLAAKATWLKARAAARKTGQPDPKAPGPFKNQRVSTPGGLFASMIAPVAPYAVRGVLWYQGERNAAGPFTGLYGKQLATLIADWRAHWGAPELPFFWVQLPAFQKPQTLPSEPKGWGVQVREGMRQTLAVPYTGMAITLDLGDAKAGHPTNKAQFAARLARVVLHEVYGLETGQDWTGPLYQAVRREGGQLTVSFTHAAGLRPAAGALQGFAIAGEDRKFVWAEARILGEEVVLSSPQVPAPLAVRYGWAANPVANLCNGEGLPASPFRTDHWAP